VNWTLVWFVLVVLSDFVIGYQFYVIREQRKDIDLLARLCSYKCGGYFRD
jgi:hypothetical protein